MSSQSGIAFREIKGLQPSTASTSNSVLIIIDAQNFYASGPLEILELEKSRPNVLTILKNEGENTPATDGPAAEFEELTPIEGESVVIKNLISSFAKTNLQEILEKIGKKKIVLVGYMAHVCVSTTARAGNDLGYDVLVLSDAVGDRDIPGASATQVLQVVLAELGDAFATIIRTTDIL